MNIVFVHIFWFSSFLTVDGVHDFPLFPKVLLKFYHSRNDFVLFVFWKFLILATFFCIRLI